MKIIDKFYHRSICFARTKIKNIFNQLHQKKRLQKFNKFMEEQEKFKNLASALVLHNEILKKINVPITHFANNDDLGFNYLHFCSLKLAGFEPRGILELGTFFGATTKYLSALFPMARIYTFEIPPDYHLYEYFFSGENGREREIALSELHKISNISLLRDSSSNILQYDLRNIDLVWLDGDHRIPFVYLDIYNAYQVLRSSDPEGSHIEKHLMIDDIVDRNENKFLHNIGYYNLESDVHTSMQLFCEEKKIVPNLYPCSLNSKIFTDEPRYIADIKLYSR